MYLQKIYFHKYITIILTFSHVITNAIYLSVFKNKRKKYDSNRKNVNYKK